MTTDTYTMTHNPVPVGAFDDDTLCPPGDDCVHDACEVARAIYNMDCFVCGDPIGREGYGEVGPTPADELVHLRCSNGPWFDGDEPKSTLADMIWVGDWLYDGPHRGLVVKRYEPVVGESAKYVHLDVRTDSTIYRVALVREDRYSVYWSREAICSCYYGQECDNKEDGR